MKLKIRLLSVLSILPLCCAQNASSFDLKHRALTGELRKYVDENGVHYKRWQKHKEKLKKYIRSLATLKDADYEKMSPLDREALWLNVYDAFTIKLILDMYPIHGTNESYPANSPRQIVDFWEIFDVNVAGKKLNLYQIEHEMLRRDMKDPRTHFAVSPAARGGGAVPRHAYTAQNVDQELESAAQKFLANKSNVELDAANKTIWVTKLFQWFPLDFAREAGFEKISFPPPSDDDIIRAYLALHGPESVRTVLADPAIRAQYKVEYREFDWTLNDADQLK